MGIKISETSKSLKTARFQVEVSTPIPGLPISTMHVGMSKNFDDIGEMLAVAMTQSNEVAGIIILAAAMYQVNENVDVLRLLHETACEVRAKQKVDELNHQKKSN